MARRRCRRRSIELRVAGFNRSGPDTRGPISVPGPAGELWEQVRILPERQRTAVALRHVGHLSEAQIAEAMGIARGTVSATVTPLDRKVGR